MVCADCHFISNDNENFLDKCHKICTYIMRVTPMPLVSFLLPQDTSSMNANLIISVEATRDTVLIYRTVNHMLNNLENTSERQCHAEYDFSNSYANYCIKNWKQIFKTK